LEKAAKNKLRSAANPHKGPHQLHNPDRRPEMDYGLCLAAGKTVISGLEFSMGRAGKLKARMMERVGQGLSPICQAFPPG